MADWIPLIVVFFAAFTAITLVQILLRDRTERSRQRRFKRQILTVAIIFVSLVAVLFTLPDGGEQDVLLGVLGLVFTGALAISSQSIIANGMAGAMLRLVGSFRPGDFIEVGDYLGRVTETGLFHTEVQTADRDLVTLPNALMVTEPVRVVRTSGTIVSVTVGLGYDLSRHMLEDHMIAAATDAGLEEPFVQVLELGDFAVTYRVAGFLSDVTKLLATRSRLRGAILDRLSDNGIEIMSPSFIARRSVGLDPVLPERSDATPRKAARKTAEDRAFDKAELAGALTHLRTRLTEIGEKVDGLRAEIDGTTDADQLAALETSIATEERRSSLIARRIEHLEDERESQE